MGQFVHISDVVIVCWDNQAAQFRYDQTVAQFTELIKREKKTWYKLWQKFNLKRSFNICTFLIMNIALNHIPNLMIVSLSLSISIHCIPCFLQLLTNKGVVVVADIIAQWLLHLTWASEYWIMEDCIF